MSGTSGANTRQGWHEPLEIAKTLLVLGSIRWPVIS